MAQTKRRDTTKAMRQLQILARLAVRTYDYVGPDDLPEKMDCDRQMQGLSRKAFDLLGGEEAARNLARGADPKNEDGRKKR